MMQKQNVLVALSLAALVAAQNLDSLSAECKNGISAISNDAEANKCLATNQLSSIIASKAGDSVIVPMDNWLHAVCAAPDCSASTIESVVTSVSQACSKELGTAATGQVGNVLPFIQKFFGPAKSAICLADKQADKFCATTTAQKYETETKQKFSAQNIAGIYTAQGLPAGANATSLACTPCGQAVVVIFEQNTELAAVDPVKAQASQLCGAEFAAATSLPANIVVGTGSNVPKGTASTSDNSASSLAVAGPIAAVVSAALVMFLA